MRPGYERGRTFNPTLLAEAQVARGEIERACHVGMQAVRMGARIQSARSVREIERLRRKLRAREDVAAAREFAEVVSESRGAREQPSAR